MDKKTIQEDRIRNYFIDAARDIIRGEGINAISARNVADRAGYSYGTLYNYFKDIRDLIFQCAQEFMSECREFVIEQSAGAAPGRERCRIICREYAKFFIQYPGIFELLFTQKLTDMATSDSEVTKIDTLFDSLIAEEINTLAAEDLRSAGNGGSAGNSLKNLKFSLHGLLMLTIFRRHPLPFPELMAEIDQLVEICLS